MIKRLGRRSVGRHATITKNYPKWGKLRLPTLLTTGEQLLDICFFLGGYIEKLIFNYVRSFCEGVLSKVYFKLTMF